MAVLRILIREYHLIIVIHWGMEKFFWKKVPRKLFIPSSDEGLVWFGLVSWFNGISTFLGYLMPKLSS